MSDTPPTTGTTSTSASSAAAQTNRRSSRSQLWAYGVLLALAAFSDNYLRSALGWWAVANVADAAVWPVAIAGSVIAFALPAGLLSGLAGAWADGGDRGRLVWVSQLHGLLAGMVGAWGLYAGEWRVLAFAVLAAGVRAALFGPVKYRLIAELLPEGRWLAANGWVEGSTYVAALLGTAAGVLAIDDRWGSLAALLSFWPALGAVAVAGVFAKRYGASGTGFRSPGLWAAAGDAVGQARAGVGLWRVTLALAWFWLLAQAFVGWLPAYARDDLGVAAGVGATLSLLFAAGVALGAYAVNRLSNGWLELGIVPLGTLGISAFALDLAFAESSWRAGMDLAGVGFSAAFLGVPLHTAVITWSSEVSRGRVIAAGNLIAAVGMAVGAAGFALLAWTGWPVSHLWFALALLNLVVTAVIYRTAPEFLLRFLAWILSHVLYRVSVEGGDKVPREGAAVLVCNHITFVDWLVLMGAIRRPARFVMYKGFFDMPVAGVLFRQGGVIPIAGAKEDPVMLERAMDEISATLLRGQLVVLFPEGSLTPDGAIQQFRAGIERIVVRDPVPVVPMALNGLWGSSFSRAGGKAFAKLFPRGVRSRVWVTLGEALEPVGLSAAQVQRVVTDLWRQRPEP